MGQMGGVPVMTHQPLMYNQPVLRPTNPFTPMPGAQVSCWGQCPPSSKVQTNPPPLFADAVYVIEGEGGKSNSSRRK